MPDARPAPAPPRDLPRTLGLIDSILLVSGIVIGSGIFLTSGIIVKDLPSGPLLLAVWAAGGALSLAGALAYAELGTMMPHAGGQYLYLKEAYGDLAGFLFGWIALLVYQSGSIAAVSVGFAEYLAYFRPELGTDRILLELAPGGWSFQVNSGQCVAAAAIAVLTGINVLGVRQGAAVSNLFTTLKIGAILAFVLFGFAAASVAPAGADAATPPIPLTFSTALSGIGLAMVAVLWSYDGWNNLGSSAGEVKNPSRNIPLALLLGTGLVTLLYVSVNAAYLKALTIPEMSGATRVAEKAAQSLWGGGSAGLIAAAVMISSFGCVNGMVLTGARVYYAMARDGLFFSGVGRVHPRFVTPARALIVQGAWSILLTLSGRYDQLYTYAVFAAMLMYAASVATVFTLRRKRPDQVRPYRAWGYPILPALYLAGLGLLILNTIYTSPVQSLAGLGIIAAGLPAFSYFRKRRPTP